MNHSNRIDLNTIGHIYLDMDGVLCDFKTKFLEIHGDKLQENTSGFVEFTDTKNGHILFEQAAVEHKIFSKLEPMPDMDHLLDHVYMFCYENTHVTLSILTSVATSNSDLQQEIRKQKTNWLIDHNIFVRSEFVAQSVHKAKFAKEHCLLIDDNHAKCILPFKQAGGQVIHHKSAEETIKHLPLERVTKECLRTA